MSINFKRLSCKVRELFTSDNTSAALPSYLIRYLYILCLVLAPVFEASAKTISDIRINAGGDTYIDSQGNTWSADTGYNTGRIAVKKVAIAETQDEDLHYTQRWHAGTTPGLVYSFTVPNGDYAVILHFAETYSGTSAVGLRVFDVFVENTLVFNDIDIFSEAGGANIALKKTLPRITVNDGLLEIEFLKQIQNPTISAIEIISLPAIEPLGAQSIPVNTELNFNVITSDPDGTTPLLSCTECPPGANLDLNGKFTWTPSASTDTSEPQRVVFRAVDANNSNLFVDESVYITISSDAPSLPVINDVSVVEGETLRLNLKNVISDSMLSAIIFDSPLTDTLEVNGVGHNFVRNSPATYYDQNGKLKHAEANTPRFSANNRGLLIEGKRTNLIAPSINLNSAPWISNFDGSAIDNFGIAPDGTLTSTKIIGSSIRYAGRKIPVSLTPVNRYVTLKNCYANRVHLKAGDSTLSRHGVYNNTRSKWESYVELAWSNGVPSIANSFNTSKDNNDTRGDIYLNNTGYQGWWTLVFSFCQTDLPDSTDDTYFHVEPDRTGTSGYIEAWGAQVEYGHLSTSYIHNTTGTPAVREDDLLTYDIGNSVFGFPSNNVMVESEYRPQWRSTEVRGWHPRLWGSKVDNMTYFLAKTSNSSPNFVAVRTFDANRLRESVASSNHYPKDSLIRVIVRSDPISGLEIFPDFKRSGTCSQKQELAANQDPPKIQKCVENKQDQLWGNQLMIGNLTDHNYESVTEWDGPLNAPTRHMRVHVLDSDQENVSGVSIVNGVFIWTPAKGSADNGPYTIIVRATAPFVAYDPLNTSAYNAENLRTYVQQEVKITVTPSP